MLQLYLSLFLYFSFVLSSQATENDISTKYHIIQKGESLHKISESFDLGFDEILEANPQIKDTIIYAGNKLILPMDHLVPKVKHEGIVINLAESRLYFFHNKKIISFPVSIGSEQKTPVGETKIIAKKENPSWIPTKSIREERPDLPEIVPPGPENPLGNYALYLDASKDSKWQSIAIHGTNAPWTIGSRVSHGCIRLYPKDIEKLFSEVEIGELVSIVNQAIKVKELNDKVYLETHFENSIESEQQKANIIEFICQEIENCSDKIDWRKVYKVSSKNLGIPVNISYSD
jgi:L,D-transpeptidase ErfK/SrfK